ncbi:FG-GAP-like repeat-containing protein [Fimbriiglobus ruber]|uniref:Teneurin NHL domain-containing protein n=1 Tax=Fimbriiglobus ruber TaxID=1908690 RepID=A0A225DJL2_9BACT|nr:FG-GAP-like repeat-containing protein [Fimbriiglobus ruber]OWK37626.1 hypothetical protein FRUB_06746 [Fimbriiglobus ruber]
MSKIITRRSLHVEALEDRSVPASTALPGQTFGTITVAGNGSSGLPEVSGAATAVPIGTPKNIAVDSAGDLFFNDGNGNLREVVAGSTDITNVTGPGAKAVVVNGTGDQFLITDNGAQLQKYNPGTGTLTVVAGTGTVGNSGDGGPATAAQLGSVISLAEDGAGNLFIGDSYNGDVRRVDAATGRISTVIARGGPPNGGTFTVDTLAVDKSGNLFVAGETFNGSTYVPDAFRVDAGTGAISVIVLASNPYGMAVDGSGNLYTSQAGSIDRINISSGQVTSIAGTGTPGFSGDGGPASGAQVNVGSDGPSPSALILDGTGDLYFSDALNNAVRRIDAATGVITTVAGNGTLGLVGTSGPALGPSLINSIATDSAGDLFIADTDDHVIREVVSGSGVIKTVAGTGFTGTTGDNGPATAAQLTDPTQVAVDASGDVFILDSGTVRKVSASTGVISTISGLNETPDFIAVDPAGNLYVTPTFPETAGPLKRIDAQTGSVTSIATDSSSAITSMAVDAAGDIYLGEEQIPDAIHDTTANDGSSQIVKLSTSEPDGSPSVVPGFGATGSTNPPNPVELAIDQTGNLIIADYTSETILRLNPNTGVSTPILSNTTANGLGVDASGNLYYSNGTTVSELLQSLPTSLAVGADTGSGQVQVYTKGASTSTTLTPFGSSYTAGVRVADADLNGDGVADVIAGTGPGVPTQVQVLDGKTGAVLATIDPFESTFTGGVFVAAGDLNGDGVPDVVVTPDQGGGPVVAVYDGAALAQGNVVQIARFFGIQDPNFRGGDRAAVGDLTGTGGGDLIVAAGFGGGPRIAGYVGSSLASGTPVKLFADFFAFEPSVQNGAYVAVGDVNGDGKADLIAGAGPGGGPRVTVFDGASLLDNQQTTIADFFAGDPSNRGGIRVAAKDLDGSNQAGVVVGSGSGAGATVTAYTGAALTASPGSPASLFDFDALPGFTGGVFVG